MGARIGFRGAWSGDEPVGSPTLLAVLPPLAGAVARGALATSYMRLPHAAAPLAASTPVVIQRVWRSPKSVLATALEVVWCSGLCRVGFGLSGVHAPYFDQSSLSVCLSHTGHVPPVCARRRPPRFGGVCFARPRQRSEPHVSLERETTGCTA